MRYASGVALLMLLAAGSGHGAAGAAGTGQTRTAQASGQGRLEEMRRLRQQRSRQEDEEETQAEIRRIREHTPFYYAEMPTLPGTPQDKIVRGPARRRSEHPTVARTLKQQHGGQEAPDERCRFLWERPTAAQEARRKAEERAERELELPRRKIEDANREDERRCDGDRGCSPLRKPASPEVLQRIREEAEEARRQKIMGLQREERRQHKTGGRRTNLERQ